MFDQFLKLLQLFKFKRFFKIKKRLGQGGFGKVFLVARKADQKLLAVKQVKKSKVSIMVESTSGILPLELYCLKKLRHDNIIQTHGYLETKFHWNIFMEYIPRSMDLFDFVEMKKRLCESLARDIFIQVHDAVSYCLSMGIDHRDIKDENILIDTNTHKIKLIDFGSASLYDRTTPYTIGRGTEVFLPPEFFYRGYFYPIDGTTWALGCLVYKMVMGYYPFGSSEEVIAAQPRIVRVSPWCRSFIKLCLVREPQERIEYRYLLIHPWFALDKTHL